MTGIAPDKPVFLFTLNAKEKILKQLSYALQWKGETKDAAWTIFQADHSTGKLTPFVSGVGLEEYEAKVKDLENTGITQAEILWGGPLTVRERTRLENPKTLPGRKKGDKPVDIPLPG